MMMSIEVTVSRTTVESRTTIVGVCRTDNTTVAGTIIGRGIASVGYWGITIVIIAVAGITAIVAVSRSVAVGVGCYATDHCCAN
jgi:hypothetical protein